MDGDGGQAGRGRRKHSAAFKAQVLQACSQPGVSVAAVALSNGLNANLVRSWLRSRGVSGVAAVVVPAQSSASSAATHEGRFVAVQLADRPAAPADIWLELRRGSATVSVSWPSQDAAACGAWLREWLR